MKLKKLIILVILLIFLCSCSTYIVKLESPEDFKSDYEKVKTQKELHEINAKRILNLKKIIYKLWVQILAANDKNIKIIDLRNYKDIQDYIDYISNNH